MREGLLIAGKYTLLRPLGAGGMGTVWMGRNELTEREFAIKLLHAEAASNPRLLMRFFQEAKVSGRLRHPSILEIFDVGTAPELGGAPFLVMELLEGASIDILLAQRGALSVRVTLQMLIAICHALALAHDRGIIHRDIKPGNIFLHRSIVGGIIPKLLDFGISKIASSSSPDATVGLTQTGAVLGSPLYMSPEQAAGDRELDARSDIHALGVVLWECLTGKAPFKAETYNNLVVEIMTGDRPRLSMTLPMVTDGLSEIASRAFARKPDDRYDTAREMAAALEAELEKLGPGPPLETKGLADELLAAVQAVHPHTAPATEPQAHASTTGAVSVPSSAAKGKARDPNRSPAAYTIAPTTPAPLAYAQTEIAHDSPRRTTGGSAAVSAASEAVRPEAITTGASRAAAGVTATPQSMPVLAPPQPAPRKRGWLAVAGSVTVLAAITAGVVVTRSGGTAPTGTGASPSVASPEPKPTPLATAATTTPSAAPAPLVAVVPSAGAASADGGTAAAAPTHLAPRPSPPRVAVQPAPAPRPSQKPPPPPPPDPHHGITNSGL